jgi:hypothetical protein
MNVFSGPRVFTPCCGFFRDAAVVGDADNPAVPTVRGRFVE